MQRLRRYYVNKSIKKKITSRRPQLSRAVGHYQEATPKEN
jgi:hypothetical protein